MLTNATGRADAPAFTARSAVVYQGTEHSLLFMPTDVSVAQNGHVFVADGVNDRVVEFDPSGKLLNSIDSVGDVRLSHPVGVTVGPDGDLWIADNGNGRVVARKADGSLGQVIIPQPNTEGKTPDITDIAIDAEGKTAWLVDNDHHRMLRVDVATQTQMQVGRPGESIGQFQFPFMVALDRNNDPYVIESINARISLFSKDGAPRRAISSYGIDEGQLYRPTGICFDAADRIWVADATLGVIQIFQTDGQTLGALHDASGEILRFDHCMGIAFDSNGRLYVTELNQNRVRSFDINEGKLDPRRPQSPRRNANVTGKQARGCTICHIEWFEDYANPNASTLINPLEPIANEPIVSRSKTCLSCHDGSVGDSRKRVWREHGHRTGIVPPLNMKVPDQLPLVNGEIKCRTCHSAHTSGTFNSGIDEAVFLRVDNRAGGLCLSCHSDKARGPELGSHPIGGMPWAIPEELVAAGAKIGTNPREITCMVCHTPHGAAHDHLLVMATESNQLCLSCHNQMRPGMFRDGSHTEHPLFPVANEEQKAAVKKMGTRLGDDDKLICLSCHKLHHGKGKRFMLAAELTDGEMCISCHSEKTSVLDTSHDLRTNYPEETNRLGMTPKTGGPCSSCHMFHRYARAPEPHPLDKLGQCITCHQADRCAGEKTLGEINHPKAACTDCHNPHTNQFDHFMIDRPANVCGKCHTDQTQLVSGPHDMLQDKSNWPATSATMSDSCLACHMPHSDNKHQLMRVAPVSMADHVNEDAACLACHADAAQHASSSHTMIHPNKGEALNGHHGLPLFADEQSQNKTIGCKTCHNPHGGAQPAGHLLRVEHDQSALDLCIKCHTDMGSVAFTAHANVMISHAGGNAESCLPCHSVHADPARYDRNLLFPKELTQSAIANASPLAANSKCAGCHRPGGTAQPPVVASHPEIAMQAVGEQNAPSFLPLFDQAGSMTPDGEIACATCHIPHGRFPDDAVKDIKRMSDAERKAMRLMLRPFEAPNTCTTCHGLDALRRFLYFHDPAKRSGPLNPGGRTGTFEAGR